MTTWPKRHAWLLLCALFPLAGCLLEDSITITNDGRVRFEAIVSEPDVQKQIEFPVLEKTVSNLVEELRRNKWMVTEKWTSKERPYRVTITGIGNLPDVDGSTSVYTLSRANNTTYKLSLLTPMNSRVRVAFQSSQGSATIVDEKERPVYDLEDVQPREVFTIVLK